MILGRRVCLALAAALACGAATRVVAGAAAGVELPTVTGGRADTLLDAVLDHGGEASIVRDRFFELAEAERQALYRFLSAL